MSLNVEIKDGEGSGKRVKITQENALFTQDTGLPPIEQDGSATVYRKYLSDAVGAFDMRVDGSGKAADFYIEAEQDYDLYIGSLSFVIADAGATLNVFGNIGALTNGCELLYQNQLGDIQVADSLKTNFEFIRLCQGNPAYGNGTTAFRANNVAGTSEGYIPVLDFKDVFGLTWGVKLRKGSSDRLILRIKDNLTGVDEFTCIAYGFTRR